MEHDKTPQPSLWRRFMAWFGDPWTADQRAVEEDELAELRSEGVASGAPHAPGRVAKMDRVRQHHRARRIRLRIIGIVIVVVAITAFLVEFTGNRAVHGIAFAAEACAAPIALYLALRRD